MDGGIGSPVPLDTLRSFDVDLALGIGAGMEAEDSRTIRAARRFLRSDVGRRLHRSLGNGAGRNVAARLGRALSYACDGWLSEAPDEAALHVHTRPPIHWLNFHRAEAAIRAGDEALNRFIPRIRQAAAGT